MTLLYSGGGGDDELSCRVVRASLGFSPFRLIAEAVTRRRTTTTRSNTAAPHPFHSLVGECNTVINTFI